MKKNTHHQHHEPGMPFDFSYSVNDVATANDYAHKAVSDGDVTRGEYRVALPDGRTQIVRYTADWKNGYNAEVRSSSSTPHQTPFSTHNSIENSRHTTYIRFLSKYILLVLWRYSCIECTKLARPDNTKCASVVLFCSTDVRAVQTDNAP